MKLKLFQVKAPIDIPEGYTITINLDSLEIETISDTPLYQRNPDQTPLVTGKKYSRVSPADAEAQKILLLTALSKANGPKPTGLISKCSGQNAQITITRLRTLADVGLVSPGPNVGKMCSFEITEKGRLYLESVPEKRKELLAKWRES